MYAVVYLPGITGQWINKDVYEFEPIIFEYTNPDEVSRYVELLKRQGHDLYSIAHCFTETQARWREEQLATLDFTIAEYIKDLLTKLRKKNAQS